MDFGIKPIREKLGLNQNELAALLGVHPVTVSKWEREKGKPSAYQIGILCRLGMYPFLDGAYYLNKYGAVIALALMLNVDRKEFH